MLNGHFNLSGCLVLFWSKRYGFRHHFRMYVLGKGNQMTFKVHRHNSFTN